MRFQSVRRLKKDVNRKTFITQLSNRFRTCGLYGSARNFQLHPARKLPELEKLKKVEKKVNRKTFITRPPDRFRKCQVYRRS